MPGKGYRCPPGCQCGHHNRPKQSDAEYRRKQNDAARKYREANRQALNTKARGYRSSRSAEAREREQIREKARSFVRRFSRYGLTPERFIALVEEQRGCCYLCSEPLDLETPRKAHIDHDHSCCRGDTTCGNCVRGVACARCNAGIAQFGDSPERLERAAAALRAAAARIAERLAARPVQEELPLNVTPLRRKESA